LANSLGWLIDYFNNQQGLQLQWGSWSLEDLDDRFRELKEQHRIPKLNGIEFYENHFILHRKWLPIAPGKTVVSKASQGRYFGAPKQIPDSDHFSICKPASSSALIHQYLFDFLDDKGLLPSVAMEGSIPKQGETTPTNEIGSGGLSASGSARQTSIPVAQEQAPGMTNLVMPSDAYDMAAIRMLLTRAFGDEELATFCADSFPSVYEQFSTGMSKPQKLQRLLEYCSRHRQIPKLLDLLKVANAAAFADYEQAAGRSHRSG
jgi:hypothetical protein